MSDAVTRPKSKSNSPKSNSPKSKARHAPPHNVVEQRVRTRDGKLTTIRTVDLASPTFGEDVLYVFRKNVAAARRENKRVTGVSDVEPRKR